MGQTGQQRGPSLPRFPVLFAHGAHLPSAPPLQLADGVDAHSGAFSAALAVNTETPGRPPHPPPLAPLPLRGAATLRRPLADAAQQRSVAHGASHGGQCAAVPAGQRGRQLPRGREPPGAREEGGRIPGRAGGAGRAPRPRPLQSGGAEQALGRLPGAAPAELRRGGAAAAGRLVSTGPGRLFPQFPG